MNTQLNSPSVATHDNKGIVEFNDWMFQQHDSTTTPVNVTSMVTGKNGKDLFDSDASSSSAWFEPLENILSSTTSSSTGSPTATTSITEEEVKLEPIDDSFEFTLNKLLTQEKLKQEFEDDADAEDAILSPKRSNSIVSKRRLTENQKQAHNRIEKRYRININTKIAKLQQIIPWLATEQTAFASKLPEDNKDFVTDTPTTTTTTTKKTRLNKSMILEKAVDYILYLQNNERLYEMEVMRLKSELNQYKN
ncbi:serine-rich protein Tye7p [Monosporozyma unispora]|nr:hypothetical protein C6P44_003255 [Kazachstania unispora]